MGRVRSDIRSILRCTSCGNRLDYSETEVSCSGCDRTWPVERGIVRFVAGDDETAHFYEGKYGRQIHHVPGGTSFLSRAKDWVFFNLVQSGVLGDIKRVLPPGGRILDYGCAGGIRWLGEYAEAIGVELSFPALLDVAEIYSMALQADITSLPLEDACLDVIFGSYTWEHLTPDTKKSFLAECYRTLVEGGAIVFQFDALSSNWLTRFAQRDPIRWKRGFIDNDGHIGLEPLSVGIRRIEDAGFEIVKVRKFGTTFIQYPATYGWLDLAYGDSVRWVRLLNKTSLALTRGRAGNLVDFGVTAFDRAINSIAKTDMATRAVIIARKI